MRVAFKTSELLPTLSGRFVNTTGVSVIDIEESDEEDEDSDDDSGKNINVHILLNFAS